MCVRVNMYLKTRPVLDPGYMTVVLLERDLTCLHCPYLNLRASPAESRLDVSIPRTHLHPELYADMVQPGLTPANHQCMGS